MSRRSLLAAVAFLGLGVLAWDLTRSPPAAPTATVANAGKGAAATGSRSSAATMPTIPSPSQVTKAPNFLRPAAVSHVASTPLARDFANAYSYKPIYDRLKGTAEGETPEGQYFLYRILRACATVADRKPRPAPAAQTEERRQQIAASLPEGDPRLAQRLAAFDKVTADQCAGMSGVAVTEAELSQLLRNSLAANDPKARAWQVEQDVWQERRNATGSNRAGPTLSEPQLATLRDAITSRDPEAITIAGRILSNSFRDVTVRVGPEQEPVEHRTLMNAAALLACEYGYPCGENNPRVLTACAYQGHCGVASLPDYLFYYGASPYDAQLLDRYRTILRQAAESGDWSAITIQRGNRSPNSPSFIFQGSTTGR